MSGVHQKGNNRNFDQPYPGCLGRMVNLFDLNIGVSANRLLSDKPHQDGSSLSRSRSAASRMSPRSEPIEEKVIASESKNSFSNRKSNGTTPMKMLIAQEMSGEMDSRKDPTNLVAKLMGLDALPQQEPGSAIRRSHVRGHPRSHSDIPTNQWGQQDRLFHYADPNEYKDVYEIWQQSQRSSPHKGRYEETVNDKRMALVRQKFIEAKRMSMDEKLRQSNQFQDALEVLSTNKDLFLQCLQEPNSMFSQHLYSRQSAHPPPETKRITVLRPSKMTECEDFTGAGIKDIRQTEDSVFPNVNGLEKFHPGSSPPASLKYEQTPDSTRIVVLKPNHGKQQDVKAVGYPLSQLPRIVQSEDFFEDIEDDLNQESREIAKAITQQMREKLGRHRRGETLISVCSNGYVGDESSFSKSEIEDTDGNLSDSEVMSPVSRHSWDYDNRLGSPYSSSFTRASCSPDSSVCREAKKRLSERWAVMASNGSCQEQRHVRRGSSTLGEMLALSETKKETSPGEGGSSSGEPKDSISEQRREENVDTSPRNLTRSRSLPVSSTEFGSRLNVDVSVSEKGISESPKEDTKARSVKSTIKWKVSSLFFSRNKKTANDKTLVSETKDEFYSPPGEICSDRTGSISDKGSNHASPGLLETSSAYPSNLISKQGMISPETKCAVAKPFSSEIPGHNQDQPSPISVLEPPFEEDEQTEKMFPHYLKPDLHEAESSLNFIGSNLIDKSPLIGSIARTLSWDDSRVNTSSSHPTKECLITQETDEEEQEWFSFVKTLLISLADVQSNSFLARWHSPESPLDPSLRNTYDDSKHDDEFHEAKKKQRRSIQKLVFDCVNAELAEIAGYESELGQTASTCTMVDELWLPMKVWFSCEGECESDDSSLVVIREVEGKGWNRHCRSEMENFGKEVEGELLEELVQEVVVELAGRL